MTSTTSPAPSVDLRKTPVPEIMDRVERAFGTRLDRDAMVFKRRSIGTTSDRGTWVRIERRPSERVGSQGWGIECAASLEGVAMPAWFSGASWCDPDGAAVWRVDEIELLPAMPLRRGGPLLVDPELPDDWWATLNRSLDALAATRTARIASPDTVEVSQQHVEDILGRAFRVNFDPTVTEWTVAHADLNWANVTGPDSCVLFDWEDWGKAPRGLDSATLWCSALAIPALADRVLRERQEDLVSRSGMITRLFSLAKILAYPDVTDPLLVPARREADELLVALRRDS